MWDMEERCSVEVRMWSIKNTRSSKNWLGPIQYFLAETDRRFSTNVRMQYEWSNKRGYQLASGYM